MQAEDILTATHKLEESGMTRSQSEAIAQTIIAATEPLATKADLESCIKSLKEHMATKKDVESAKVWYMVTMLGAIGTILAINALF